MKNPERRILAVLAAILLPLTARAESYPAAKGFDTAGSDSRAIAIADAVMEALGGWENWNHTHYLRWNFFGRRLHYWDKWTGDVRVESGDMVILMNINTHVGRAWEDGAEITDTEARTAALDKGWRMWVNDSYWMFMPYKLKDTGVTLRYVDADTSETGAACDVLDLTFRDVGVTPENRYRVFVDKASHLVVQWQYFEHASDEEPGFTTPWANWQRYGRILLSDGRGNRSHTDIAVFDSLPASVFNSPEPVNLGDQTP